MCESHESHESCPICLEQLYRESIGQCSNCNKMFHPECIIEWIQTNTYKSCPHCRTINSITIDGEQIPEKENIEYWDNGIKKKETITENKTFGRKRIIEKRWWSDGEPKYEIILNSRNQILSGSYFTYRYTYDMTTIPEDEIEKVRTNSIHFIRINGVCI